MYLVKLPVSFPDIFVCSLQGFWPQGFNHFMGKHFLHFIHWQNLYDCKPGEAREHFNKQFFPGVMPGYVYRSIEQFFQLSGGYRVIPHDGLQCFCSLVIFIYRVIRRRREVGFVIFDLRFVPPSSARADYFGRRISDLKAKDKRRRTDDRGQTTETDRGQKTEDRRQKTEDRRQRTEDRGQKQMDGRQKTDDGRQMIEDRRMIN